MATRLYKVNPGYKPEDVTDGAGSATVTTIVNMTVDLATNTVNEGASTRQINKLEVLLCLELLEMYIAKGDWPPA